MKMRYNREQVRDSQENRLRASTIPGVRYDGPEIDEWDYDERED